MSPRRLLLLWLAVALGAAATGTAWAAFGATTKSPAMTFSTKPDATAPTVVRHAELREGGGTPEGTIRQGGQYRLYAEVSETGNPASGIASVTADASAFDTGETAVPMTTTGCPCTVGTTSYSHRSAVLTADTTLTTGQAYAYTIALTDAAGNTRSSPHEVNIETYAQVIAATSGLVSHWRLGETTGTAAADAKTANPGTYAGGPALGQTGALAGDANRAIKLDGIDDHVTIPDAASLDRGDGPVTMEAWVRLSDADTGYQNIFNKGQGSWSMSFGTAAGTYGLFKEAEGTIVTMNRRTGFTTEFHHYVAVKNGATAVVYINGVAGTGTVTNRTLINTALPLMLGRNPGGGELLRGWMDEAAIYNQVLTPAQVLDHYKAGKGTG